VRFQLNPITSKVSPQTHEGKEEWRKEGGKEWREGGTSDLCHDHHYSTGNIHSAVGNEAHQKGHTAKKDGATNKLPHVADNLEYHSSMKQHKG
jgi:hypothetical protein